MLLPIFVMRKSPFVIMTMPRNSQDRTSLFPALTCVQCLITTAQEGNAADLNPTDQGKEVKHSILTPAHPTPTPRLGTVPLRGLTRGQPIKLLAINLHGLNATFFVIFLDPGVWWRMNFGPLKLLPAAVCAVFGLFLCRGGSVHCFISVRLLRPDGYGTSLWSFEK